MESIEREGQEWSKKSPMERANDLVLGKWTAVNKKGAGVAYYVDKPHGVDRTKYEPVFVNYESGIIKHMYVGEGVKSNEQATQVNARHEIHVAAKDREAYECRIPYSGGASALLAEIAQKTDELYKKQHELADAKGIKVFDAKFDIALLKLSDFVKGNADVALLEEFIKKLDKKLAETVLEAAKLQKPKAFKGKIQKDILMFS